MNELYLFTQGSDVFAYTSSSRKITKDSVVYMPVKGLRRTDIEDKDDFKRSDVTITFPINFAQAFDWFSQRQESVLTVQIFKTYDDVIYVQMFKGEMRAVKPNGKSALDFTFVSIYGTIGKLGNFSKYQRNCPYSVYGVGCGLDRDDFDYKTTVSAISENIITVRQAPDSSHIYGGIDAGGKLRRIRAVDGSTLAILEPWAYLQDFIVSNATITQLATLNAAVATAQGNYDAVIANPSSTQAEIDAALLALNNAIAARDAFDATIPYVFISKGCDQSLSTCATRFNNAANFGGFPLLSGINPVGKSII